MNTLNCPCGFFESIKSKKPGTNRPLPDILAEIKNGKWRGKIEHLRRLPPDEYAKEKTSLPAFLISAETKTGGHGAKDLGQHTGLLQLDYDKLGFDEAKRVKVLLAADSHVLACWISPSGQGVKAIVPIEAGHEKHKACFEASRMHFAGTYGLEADKACKDTCRACFVSYDPELILKETATPFAPLGTGQEGVTLPVNSSPSLHSRSYILNPPSPSSVLHNTWTDYPALEPFYQNLVVERLGDVQPGLRNLALVEMVPVLYSAIAPEFALLFARKFYELNADKFRDPLEQHLKEAEYLLASIAAGYQHKRLTNEEAAIYSGLEEREQTAFRICHALSRVQREDCPPPFFFISAEKLGHRMSLLTPQADRLLKRLCRLGAIRLIQKGTQRASKQPAKASRYEWLPPTFPLCEDA